MKQLTNSSDDWVCEDCLHGRRPLYGQIVWAKVGGYRWWPAQVCLPCSLPTRATLRHHQCQVGEFLVQFFGTNDHYWVTRARCFAFAEGDGDDGIVSVLHSSTSNILKRAYQRAFRQAKLAFDEVERLKQSHASKLNPTAAAACSKSNFRMIKTNKPVGNVFVQKVQLHDIPKCNCDAKDVAPCGRDSQCLNRLLKYECHPGVCVAGRMCRNQRFVRREYPKQAPVAAGSRGWGLKTLVDIKKGLESSFFFDIHFFVTGLKLIFFSSNFNGH
jgi:histone-lysine N-methyltransferase NSD2